MPKSNSFGQQKIYLMASEIGPDISNGDIIVVDKSAYYIAFNTPNKYLDSMDINNLSIIDFNTWARTLNGHEGEIIKRAVENNSVEGLDKTVRVSDSYTPRSAALFATDKTDTSDVPLECTSTMTKVDMSKLIYGEELLTTLGESPVLSVPTREPTVGAAESSTEARIVARSEGDSRNDELVKRLNIPSNLNYGYNSNSEVKTLVYVLDTYDSEKSVDTFNYKGIEGHGNHIANIIESITLGHDIKVISLNVCSSQDGTCDTRMIIDGICQAAFEARNHKNNVVVNMSFSTYLGSTYLLNAIKFARDWGVDFVVANGNADQCAMYVKGSKCNQYPADWAQADWAGNGLLISVGALEPNYGKTKGFLDFASFDRQSIMQLDDLSYATVYAAGEYYAALTSKNSLRRFGTSFATPYVTGILALWKTSNKVGFRTPCRIGKLDKTLGVQVASYPSKESSTYCLK